MVRRLAAAVVHEYRVLRGARAIITAGNGASRNEKYEAENTWTMSAFTSSLHEPGPIDELGRLPCGRI